MAGNKPSQLLTATTKRPMILFSGGIGRNRDRVITVLKEDRTAFDVSSWTDIKCIAKEGADDADVDALFDVTGTITSGGTDGKITLAFSAKAIGGPVEHGVAEVSQGGSDEVQFQFDVRIDEGVRD